MAALKQATERVALVGLGAVGRELAVRLQEGIGGYALAAVATGDHHKARRFLDEHSIEVPLVQIGEIVAHADLVVECAPSSLLVDIAEPMLRAGREVVVLSVGALAEHPELVPLAEAHGGRIWVPSGALLGLDAVGAAAQGKISSVQIVSSKPSRGLAGAPYLVAMGIDAGDITEPTQVFTGTARDAAKGFPANLNVAMALALAGVGPDETHVDVRVDPTLTRNTHVITVESDSARLSMKIENIPTNNPRTGRITALSVVSLLRKRNSALVVGS